MKQPFGQNYPGPSRLQLLMAAHRIRHDIPVYLQSLAEEHGDTVFLPLNFPTWLVRNPADVKHVLVSHAAHYHKTGALRADQDFLGEGLVSSAPPLHTRQRKLMQPMFHRRSINEFVHCIKKTTLEQIASWKDGDEIELTAEMMELTLKIVGRTLFSVDLTGEAAELGDSFVTAQRLVIRRMQKAPLPRWVPTLANFRYRKAIRRIDEAICDLIEARRRSEEELPDLLGMLLKTRNEDGSSMGDRLIRDEAITLLLAGHETVSNNLSWTFHLLSENPDVDKALLEEWIEVLGERTPEMDDFCRLPVTDRVLAESLRLFPPAWILARKALEEDILPSGLRIRQGDEVILPPYVIHRNPAFFDDPERFDPARWTQEMKKSLPTGTYLPFGVGPRYCIGEQFARTEAAIVLSTIGQRFRLNVLPDQRIGREAMITMRPRYGLRVKLEAREVTG